MDRAQDRFFSSLLKKKTERDSARMVSWEGFLNKRAGVFRSGHSSCVFTNIHFKGKVKDIIFRESEEKIRSFALENGKVPLVSWKSCLTGNEYEGCRDSLKCAVFRHQIPIRIVDSQPCDKAAVSQSIGEIIQFFSQNLLEKRV